MFSSLRLRAKLLLLALLPVLLLTLLISGISVFLLQGLARQQEDQARDSLIAARKSGLQQLVVQGRSQIEDIYQASAPDDTAARDRALAVLGRLSYEPESYFWGYDENCIRTLHGSDGEGVGKDYSKARDPNGVYSCIEQVKAGKNGTHYVYYTFKLGTSDKVVPKIGYAEWLDKWKMVIGTSLNLDDIELTVQAEQERFQANIRKLMGVMIGSALALFAVVAVLATLFSGTILRPLLRIQANLDDMASGDGNLTHRLPVDSTDELGDVATAFNSFMEKIHGMVKQVAGTTTHLSSLVGAVSEQAQRSEEATEGQRKETEQVATAIHQMTAAAQEVAASAQRASEAARQTDQEGAAAKQVVEGSVIRIHQLVDEIRSGNLAIDSLREDVKGIVGVLEVIRGIANQTNLLALNAAIEAARAGESGRGFAVVADEVRALASRTQQSTGEIQTMIDRLQAATQQAVQAMHRASAMGTDTTAQANLAGQSLDEIAKLIATINTMNAQIAGAAGQQTTAVEEISQSVHEIATSVDGVAADAAQGAHTARELHGIGGKLQALVGQFKI